VLFHSACAIVLVGASTHQLVIAFRVMRGRPNPRLARLYGLLVAATYGATMVLGALAYPTYRYYVRGLFLDRHAIWASNLFDMKENFSTIALPLELGTWWLGRVLDGEDDRAMRRGYFFMVALQAGIFWFDVAAGLLVTMVRGV
jgi:hypothetical protein